MIARLTGILAEQLPGYAIVDVNGVGYKVEGSFGSLKPSETITLYIHTHVRENELRLFGFTTLLQLSLFEELLGVSGVGPKTAVAMINNLGLEKIVSAISGGKPSLLKTPGVGGKTAERVVLELKSKIANLGIKADPASFSESSTEQELVQALLDFGYGRAEVSAAVKGLDFDKTDLSALIKLSLQKLRK
jgi:Holliday junction DNA helicase RuvA